MLFKRLFSFFTVLAVIFSLATISAIAEDFEDVQEDDGISDNVKQVVEEDVEEEVVIEEEDRTPKRSQEACGFEFPDETEYKAEVVSVRRKLQVEKGEVFRVKVFLKNNGNMPWFSNDSICLGPKMSLGTDKDRDRDSVFYADSLPGIADTNWEGANRIGMDQLRVNSGEIASFTFYAQAPDKEDIRKEYFTPVLKDLQWIEDPEAKVEFEVIVGDVNDDTPLNLRKKLAYKINSGSALDLNLDGEKMLLVDLSDQRLYLHLDDQVIAEFMTSTGASATPTPVGETTIKLKQDVRIGGKAPHYIMPKFMWFRAGGYGFHALPSLGGNGDYFWTEARSHIGIPVSHGCVRLLPEDADFAFDFTEVGTKVVVQR
ncbi:L,D-transpeptidase [Candidatus Peregrinibacteria bacterium]|jgi:hypothetical protein|nr:L,D-transpeptidase [Candidatus Peregrinibacteria bacterium]MBT7737003.1 L,D-transpeptidase [Candidatus Peregrinibacteria bacterium]